MKAHIGKLPPWRARGGIFAGSQPRKANGFAPTRATPGTLPRTGNACRNRFAACRRTRWDCGGTGRVVPLIADLADPQAKRGEPYRQRYAQDIVAQQGIEGSDNPEEAHRRIPLPQAEQRFGEAAHDFGGGMQLHRSGGSAKLRRNSSKRGGGATEHSRTCRTPETSEACHCTAPAAIGRRSSCNRFWRTALGAWKKRHPP